MRIYGVYIIREYYTDWIVVVTNVHENYFEGLSFNSKGEFIGGVTLRSPVEYEEIGYIYTPKYNFTLKLEKI